MEKPPKFPKSIGISNWSKFPKFPTKFNIGNINTLASSIAKKFPKKIEVSNLEKIAPEKLPKNLSKLSFDTTENILMAGLKLTRQLSKGIKDGIFIKNKKPDESIPVRLVNKAGEEFTELKHTVVGGPRTVSLKNAENPAVEENQDPTARYQLSDFDISDTPFYVGKIDVDGKWFIKQIDTTYGETLYAKGDDDYPTNWANKFTLTYDTFDNVF